MTAAGAASEARRPDASAAPAPALAGVLCLAATPTFAVMALLSVLHGHPMAGLCGSGAAGPMGGMTLMYVLMSAFHAPPWLTLIRTRDRARRARRREWPAESV